MADVSNKVKWTDDLVTESHTSFFGGYPDCCYHRS